MLIRFAPARNDADARERLAQLVTAQREDYAGLSRMIGRPAGYLGRYVREGVPARLSAREAQDMADYLRVERCELLHEAA